MSRPSRLVGDPPPRAEAAPELPAVRESVVVDRYARRDWLLRRALAGSDALALTVSLAVAGLIGGRAHVAELVLAMLPALPLWVLLLRSYGLYDQDAKRISHSTVDDVPGLFHALFIGTVLLWAYCRLVLPEPLFLLEVIVFTVTAMVLMVLARSVVRARMRRLGPRNVLIVGAGESAEVLTRKLHGHPEYGVRVVGQLRHFGARWPSPTHADRGLPILGGPDDLSEVAREHEIDRLIVAADGLDRDELLPLLRRAKQLRMRVSLLPGMFDLMGPSVVLDEIEGVTMLGLDPPVLSRSSRVLKRSLDVVGSLSALVVSMPFLALVAVAIKVDSRGPVFFRQDRIGRGGENVRLYKFRSMVRDAEARRARLVGLSEDPHWLKLAHDPRITRVGRFLRLTSLDELPQLLNVLRGEMSLVGPRPLIPAESERVAEWGRARLDLTPGITGLWQVLGRTSIPFEEMVKLDYVYVTNWSLWGDVRLLLRTLPAVLSGRGAN